MKTEINPEDYEFHVDVNLKLPRADGGFIDLPFNLAELRWLVRVKKQVPCEMLKKKALVEILLDIKEQNNLEEKKSK